MGYGSGAEMSMVYCEECDYMIDLDQDEHYEHFKEMYEEFEE